MPDSILAIRIHAGFNASSFTAGLLALTEQTSGTAGAYLRSLFPGLDIGLELKPAWVRGISGWTVKFLTPAETGHGHRHPEDIEAIYAASRTLRGRPAACPSCLARTRVRRSSSARHCGK